MIPESLREILTACDYVDFDIDILKIDISTDPLKMTLQISDTEGSNGKTTISMTASGVADFYIGNSDHLSYTRLEHDSPLLWRYNDTQCELYISGGQPKQTDKIIFDLLQIHHSFFGHYLRFDLEHLLSILNNGYGLLNKGSRKLLTAFAGSLKKHGVGVSLIGELPPPRKDLKILFIEHSYIIANNFEFER